MSELSGDPTANERFMFGTSGEDLMAALWSTLITASACEELSAALAMAQHGIEEPDLYELVELDFVAPPFGSAITIGLTDETAFVLEIRRTR